MYMTDVFLYKKMSKSGYATPLRNNQTNGQCKKQLKYVYLT